MALEVASIHRWRSVLVILLFTAVFNRICHVSPEYSPHVLHLHDVLSSFTARGQASVELFAPLSTVVGSSLDGRFFLAVASYITWPLVGATFLWTLQAHKTVLVSSHPLTQSALYALLAGVVWFFTSIRHQHVLSLLNQVADAFLALAIATITAGEQHPRWLRALRFFGLGEALVLASYAIGSNDVDAVVAYFVIFVARARTLAQKVADPRRSVVALTCEGVLSLSISCIVCPVSILLLSSALLPASEAAAGGNYNLRYLSAAARRELTPFPAIPSLSTQAALDFRLHRGTAYTLYVPGAGFLWSDSMVWEQSVPKTLRDSTNPYDDQMEEHWSIEGSHRIFFQDKFVERYPWEIQKHPGPGQVQTQRKSQTIQSGSTVRLYDSIASRYLCVIPGEPVVTEAGYLNVDHSTEDSFKRFRVGTNPNHTAPHCDWTTYYDPTEDGGIAFYSHEHRCNLGTTFRSLPSPDTNQSNDTVLRTLHLKLEASCTISASKASSRLFLVESPGRHKSLGKGKVAFHQNKSSTAADVGYLRRGMNYLQARRRLARFRRHHSNLQEEEVGSAITEIEGESPSLNIWKLEVFMCSVYPWVWMLDVAVHQRFPEKGAKWFRDGLAARSHLRGLFVFCHVTAYYILGTKMLHSSRAAGLVSLYSLTEYVMEMI